MFENNNGKIFGCIWVEIGISLLDFTPFNFAQNTIPTSSRGKKREKEEKNHSFHLFALTHVCECLYECLLAQFYGYKYFSNEMRKLYVIKANVCQTICFRSMFLWVPFLLSVYWRYTLTTLGLVFNALWSSGNGSRIWLPMLTLRLIKYGCLYATAHYIHIYIRQIIVCECKKTTNRKRRRKATLLLLGTRYI